MTTSTENLAKIQYVGIHYGVLVERPDGTEHEVMRGGTIELPRDEATHLLGSPQWRLIRPARKEKS